MIKWAIAEAGLRADDRVKIGIYSPSYVYVKPQPDVLLLAKVSSAAVATGASTAVLRKFGLYERLRNARKMAEASVTLESVLDAIPDQVVRDFSITMSAGDLPLYLAEVERLKVDHVVFAYPQNYSVETMKELKEALDLRS